MVVESSLFGLFLVCPAKSRLLAWTSGGGSDQISKGQCRGFEVSFRSHAFDGTQAVIRLHADSHSMDSILS